MSRVVKVYHVDNHQVLHLDFPVADLSYNEAVVQGVHFPAGPARLKISLEPARTTAVVLANRQDYPESFFLNHEIEFYRRNNLDAKIPMIVSLDSRG